MRDPTLQFLCPVCEEFGWGCDCDRHEATTRLAAEAHRAPPAKWLSVFRTLPLDAVARIGPRLPQTLIRRTDTIPEWARSGLAASATRWARSNRSGNHDALRATPWRERKSMAD